MPIYEYRCDACGHTFERLQKMSEPDPERCPQCGAAEVSRLISPVGFRLKGGGWYETDFKKSGRRNVSGEGEGDGKKDKPGKAADKSAGDSAAAGEKPAKTDAGKTSEGKGSAA